jgi:hypothetical protein
LAPSVSVENDRSRKSTIIHCLPSEIMFMEVVND